MNRREFIKQTAVATVAMPSLLRAQADDRPNIVLFLADDMTWRDCGVYGRRVGAMYADRLGITLVVFSTEQGSAFPYGGKWTCYENGLHTGLIMRWPGKIEAGSSSDALVQYVDILPTLLEVAGGDPTRVDTGRAGAPDGGSGFDGKSFWHLVTQNGNHHRDYVYGAYTNRGVRDGIDYPIRSVRSNRYKYIANLNHEGVFQCNVTRFMDEMGWAEAAKKNPALAPRVHALRHRPAIEFYDLENDPYELQNLSEDAQYAGVMKEMRTELDAWMAQQNDRGMKTEWEAYAHVNPASAKNKLYRESQEKKD